MKNSRLELSVELDASQKEVFDFHTNFTNVTIVTPPIIPAHFVHTPVPLREWSQMTVEMKQFGLRIPWDVTVKNFYLIPL